MNAYGIPIQQPYKIDGVDIRYIIAIDNTISRYQLKKQLIGLGIQECEMLMYFPHRCWDYNATLHREEYKSAIEKMYVNEFKRPMNWDNPVSYNEKINWEKLNLHDDRRAVLADKSNVREWVSKKIGEEYLTKRLGVWKKVKEIDFSKLPSKFVLKTNNGSSRNILVKDKSEINIEDIRSKLNYWLQSNNMFETFEMHYCEIDPCIIAEEFLDGMA